MRASSSPKRSRRPSTRAENQKFKDPAPPAIASKEAVVAVASAKLADSAITKKAQHPRDLRIDLDGLKHPRLHFSYIDADGSPTDYFYERFLLDLERGIRPPIDKEATEKEGKTVYLRFNAPKSKRQRLYFPHGLLPKKWRKVVDDARIPIYVTEGQLKAVAACNAGLHAVALSGVDSWQSRKHGVKLLPELAELAKVGHVFIIGYDSDVSTKPDVRRARGQLRDALLAAGAPEVRVVEMQQLPGGVTCGWDDFARMHGHAALKTHLESAQKPAERVDPPSKCNYSVVIRAWEGHYGWSTPDLDLGPLEYNELTRQPVFGRQPVNIDRAVSRMRACAGATGLKFSADDTRKALVAVAQEHSFHPVADYLKGLPKWDRTNWIEETATRVLQLPADDALSRTLLRKTLIGAVARALRPGCKHDTVCVLIGPQGSWKSSFWKTLAGGEEFYTDTAMDIRNKDSYLLMQSVWFYEWGELETKRRTDSETAVKAFLSSTHDKFRPPYGFGIENNPRSCIIVGTSNPERFLNDPTGARRYWPISIPVKAGESGLEWLSQHRDAIWSEALALYRLGGKQLHWIDEGTDDAKQLVARQKSEHRVVDDLEERVLDVAGPFEDPKDAPWEQLEAEFEPAELASLARLKTLDLPELNKFRGATTDEILDRIYNHSSGSYIGQRGLHSRIENIFQANGYVRKRWTLHPALGQEAKARWRKNDWPKANERGNPALKLLQGAPSPRTVAQIRLADASNSAAKTERTARTKTKSGRF